MDYVSQPEVSIIFTCFDVSKPSGPFLYSVFICCPKPIMLGQCVFNLLFDFFSAVWKLQIRNIPITNFIKVIH